jgi:hypothetical protein
MDYLFVLMIAEMEFDASGLERFPYTQFKPALTEHQRSAMSSQQRVAYKMNIDMILFL